MRNQVATTANKRHTGVFPPLPDVARGEAPSLAIQRTGVYRASSLRANIVAMLRATRGIGKKWLLLSALSAWGTAIANDAHACLPDPGQVDSVVPSDGGHPANSAILLLGWSLSATKLSATIDDAPVTVVIDEAASEWRDSDFAYSTLALRLDPEPLPGQTLSLSGDPCEYDFTRGESCDGFEVTYVAEEIDEVAPVAPSQWWWDGWFVPEAPDELLPNGSCKDMATLGDLTVSYTFGDDLVVDDSTDLLVRIWSTPESDSTAYVPAVRAIRSAADAMWLPLFIDQTRYPIAESPACIHIEVVDLAGNSSGVLESCEPCSVQFGSINPACYPVGGHCGESAPEHETSEGCYSHPVPHEPPDAATQPTLPDGSERDAGSAAENEREDARATEPDVDTDERKTDDVGTTNLDTDEAEPHPFDAGREPPTLDAPESKTADESDETITALEPAAPHEAGTSTGDSGSDSGTSPSAHNKLDAANAHEPQLKPALASGDNGSCSFAVGPLVAFNGPHKTLSVLGLALAFTILRRKRR